MAQLRHWIKTLDAKAIENAGSEIWVGEENSALLQTLRCRFLLRRSS